MTSEYGSDYQDELLLTRGMAAMVEPYMRVLSDNAVAAHERAGCLGTVARKRRRESLQERQNHRCALCGVRFSDDPQSNRYATFEHFIPKNYGGTNTPHNLAMTCHDCNKRRKADAFEQIIEVFGIHA